jgi:uncharacterized membrane protein YebE (DUF533 family)
MLDAKKTNDQTIGQQSGEAVDSFVQAGTHALEQGAAKATRMANKVMGDSRLQEARDYFGEHASALGMGAAAGGLLTLMLGTRAGRSVGASVMQLGALAALGTLAYRAYHDSQEPREARSKDRFGAKTGERVGGTMGERIAERVSETASELARGRGHGRGQGSDAAFMPRFTSRDEPGLATSLLVAMVNAAKADGVIDAKEHKIIMEKQEEAGLDGEARRMVEREMAGPPDIEKVVKLAKTPEIANQIYAASALAIQPDKASEKAYLAQLAQRLSLTPSLVSEIDRRVQEARVA